MDYALQVLKLLQKKHRTYFDQQKISIMDCVEIQRGDTVSVKIIRKGLPPEIIQDIETIFAGKLP